MNYQPLNEEQKAQWITWLKEQAQGLNGQPENSVERNLFKTPQGDVATAKDVIGQFLVTLTGSPVEIN